MKRRSYLFIAILGLMALTVGTVTLFKQSSYEKTTSIITDIEKIYHAAEENEYEYHVFVKYRAGNETYEEELGYYEDSYEVGKEISIVYNPDNPQSITTASSGFFIYLMIIGPVLMAVGGYLFIKK